MERYDFRYNEITGAIDYRKKEETVFKPLAPQAKNTLLVQLDEHFIRCSERQLDTLLRSDFSPKYNPIVEYFQGLQWDGHDHLEKLTASVKTDDDVFFAKAFRKFMLSAVAGWLDEGQYNETMLVLIGDQNVGKSTFARNLVPATLKKDYLFQGTVLQNHNDFLKQLSRKMFILVDEFDAISGKDIPRLKELITREFVETRLAYQKNDIKEPRRASFMATTNVAQPLRDLSGNRRYLCFLIRSIDWNVKVDVNQLYAQLYQLHQQGEPFKLSPDDVLIVNKRNERFTYQDVLADAILTKFKPTSDPDAERMTVKQIAKETMLDAGYSKLSHSLLTKLGTLLNNAGFKRRKSNGNYYYLIERAGSKKAVSVDDILNTALAGKE